MKIDRLIGILTILLQNNKVTAPALASRFEVSRRTILRDIDALCRAGIPVVTTQGGDGGISIMEGYKINKNVLSVDELQNLVAALKCLDSVSAVSTFESLITKLAPDNEAIVSLSDHIVIDLTSYHKESLSQKIAGLRQAISAQKRITFDYYYSKGEIVREIEPYFIEFRWNSWYVFGWCCQKEDFRRFKLNRLWNMTIKDETFHPRYVPSEKANASDSFTDQNNMQILFDKSMRFRLIEDYGLFCYKETENGLLFFLDYTNKDYIFSWLLGFGDKAEILEPKDIRKEFESLVYKIANRYRH